MLIRAAARAFSSAAIKVVNDVANQQFIATLEGQEAVLNYEKREKEITFVRVEVPPAFQGKGIAKILAKHAFDYALENKLDVICQCGYLASFFEQNKAKYGSLKIRYDSDE